MQLYSPSDEYFDNAAKLSNFMVHKRADVDMIQDVLQCNKALKQGKPLPSARTCQSPREPLRKELQIKEPVWSKLAGDTKTTWIQESNDSKEMVISRFVAESKSIVPVTKNQNSHTVYLTDFNDYDGYRSNITANTQNLEGIFQFNTNSTMFDTTTNDNSNGEILEGSDLNVNAAAIRKEIPSMLRGQQKKKSKSNKMPSGAIVKMMANKQLRVLDDNNNVSEYLIYSANWQT